MKITVLTLFPEMVTCFLNESIVARAQEKKQVEIDVINLRDFATDKYKTVDDKPYGGGAGMILKADVIFEAISSASSRTLLMRGEGSHTNEIPRLPTSGRDPRNDRGELKEKIVLTSPRGQTYHQATAQGYAKLDHLILIAGHYEGVDERVTSYIDEEVSLGDFVMTGGEIATAVIVDSVVRLLPGVLKKEAATRQESFFTVSIDDLCNAVGDNQQLTALKKKGIKQVQLLEYPQYTRPEEFQNMKVPEVLLSGNHALMEKWRLKAAYEETIQRRKDLVESK